jgi:hypothetical protein
MDKKVMEIEHRGDLATLELGIGIPRDSLANFIRVALKHRSQLKAESNILKIEQFLTEFNCNYSALVVEVKDLKLKLRNLYFSF